MQPYPFTDDLSTSASTRSDGARRLAGRTLCLVLATLLTGCEWEIFTDDKDGNSSRVDVTSRLTGAEIGVSSLAESLPIYTDGLGMEVVTEIETSAVRQVILAAPDSPFSAQLTLTQFMDGVGRNVTDNPGKLVFYAPDASAYAMAFQNAGGNLTLPPTPQGEFGIVGFGRDPDNNLIEMVQSSEAEGPYFAAFGIGVSNLEAARDFYQDMVGLEEILFLEIPERYDEYIMGTTEDATLPLVLMNWTDGSNRRYEGNETSVRLATTDPEALAEQTTPRGENFPQDLDGNRLLIRSQPLVLEDAD